VSRINAPEFEDYPWFPSLMRDAMTGFFEVASSALGMASTVVPLLRDALEVAEQRQLVDLCSGSGGPLLGVLRALADATGTSTTVVMTDLYPNRAAFERAEAAFPGQVTGRLAPTHAADVPGELPGVRTMFNALHHLPPALARAVFADAAAKRQPILVFELVERSLQGLAISLSVPWAMWTLMPLVRPRVLRALLLTYAVPILPALTWWDGMASCLRAYSADELHRLIDGLATPQYQFRVERRRARWRPYYVTCVIGMPV
jgi:hypothetical protein